MKHAPDEIVTASTLERILNERLIPLERRMDVLEHKLEALMEKVDALTEMVKILSKELALVAERSEQRDRSLAAQIQHLILTKTDVAF